MTLEELITKYYTNYYKAQLGLPDWQSRVEMRLNEEEIYCRRFIDWVEEWFDYNFTGKKVLVVGSGTGGEIMNFHRKGAIVYGIEPNEDALQICKMKAKLNNLSQDNIIKGFSEELPYPNEKFDFIYCFTVLEHVNDVNLSIREMVRCAKNKGKIFIGCPDYKQLYEGHYKLPLPMFLPKWINKIILKCLGRPSNFMDSINKINSKQLQNVFSVLPVTAIRVFRVNQEKNQIFSFSISYAAKMIQNFIKRFFGIHINQIWLLHKEI
jgi:2-polyprenyl-3-methyl-5-hydroxy-6-metoxy-1,4-benzoquinol methylase